MVPVRGTNDAVSYGFNKVDMSGIIDSLARWDGYDAIQAKIASIGFVVPKEFTRIVKGYIGESEAEILEQYWRELATEYVRSGGRTEIATIGRSPGGHFQSALLHRLQESIGNLTDRYSLIPNHDKFERLRLLDSQFTISLTKSIRELKREEYGIVTKYKDIEIRNGADKIAAFKIIAKDLGFRKMRAGFFSISNGCQAVHLAIAPERKRSLSGNTSWRFFCSLESDLDNAIALGLYRLLPASEYYWSFSTSEEYLLDAYMTATLASEFLSGF